MEWMYSTNVLIFICLCKLLSVSGYSSCNCNPEQESCKCPPCKKDYYWRRKTSGYRCDSCTQPCSVTKHLVEIKACGISTNRVCHCAEGYYCPELLNYSCVFPCKPCPPGTFSNKASLASSCYPHTDCKGRGVITEGTATQDRVCVDATTPRPASKITSGAPAAQVIRAPAPHAGDPGSIPTPTSFPDPTPTLSPIRFLSLSTVLSKLEAQKPKKYTLKKRENTPGISPSPSDAHTLTTSPGSPKASVASGALKESKTHINTRDLREGTPAPLTDSPSHWLIVLMMLLVVSVLVGCFLWLKGKALKKQLKWTRGLPFGKYQGAKKAGYNICAPSLQHEQEQQHGAEMGGDPRVERLIPLSAGNGGPPRGTDSAAQPHPGQGSTQHVTMSNSGRGENISNTVGSIFIYSPGMVVLGTNASEQRGEERQGSTERLQASVPQQESRSASSSGSSSSSSSYPDSVGFSTQEEDDDNKELSYPIPASGK
ncbi:tumor necrosis factor receptor superfamily member 21 [Sardina pilchardus]|uniref:tumor necrosis factor receptor superfamily member 21 n=1 Tax=Sardina pilchardus TaxID=27697 RepID=UPI002E1335E9